MRTRARLFDCTIDLVGMDEAVHRLLSWLGEDEGRRARYVVTPNVNHIVRLQGDKALRAAYAAADLVTVDGTPLVWLGRSLGVPVPERVAGSDLVLRLFEAAERARPSLFLLGGAAGVPEAAARRIERDWPQLRVVGTYSPPFGFERDAAECRRMVAQVNAARPDILLVGLGMPRQEVWAHRHQRELRARVVLCVGAAIDFLAGHRPRAPIWMQRAGLEWLHRVRHEPARLGPRYLGDGYRFAGLVLREAVKRLRA